MVVRGLRAGDGAVVLVMEVPIAVGVLRPVPGLVAPLRTPQGVERGEGERRRDARSKESRDTEESR